MAGVAALGRVSSGEGSAVPAAAIPAIVNIAALWLCSYFLNLAVCVQHKFGVRFFVPQFLLPVRYNYSRSIAHLLRPEAGGVEADAQKECVICYNVIEQAGQTARDHMVRHGCSAFCSSF